MPRQPRAVQTPGELPTDGAAGAQTSIDPADQPDAGAAAEPVATAPAKATRAPRATDYSQLHSTEVDAKTLTKAVLCKDGWVVPDLPPQAAQRA